MGAINYGSNDIINIGLNIPRYDHFDEEDRTAEHNFIYEETQNLIDKYQFYYFYIAIKPGYYEVQSNKETDKRRL